MTIWKKGDPIPDASEEMEKYMEMERKAYPYLYEEGKDSLSELDELENAVPEWH